MIEENKDHLSFIMVGGSKKRKNKSINIPTGDHSFLQITTCSAPNDNLNPHEATEHDPILEKLLNIEVKILLYL